MVISRLACVSFQVLFVCLVVDASKLGSKISLRDTEGKSSHHRELQKLPDGVTDCDAYFGRSTTLSDITSLVVPREQYFCVNGGFCKSTYKTQPGDPCVCVEGFAGPHCEFTGTEDDVPNECTMQCQNDGVCVIGAQSWQVVTHYNFANTPIDKIQYCTCPDGFAGPLCEFDIRSQSYTTCVNNQNCQHGGTCVTVYAGDNTMQNHCDCTTANDDSILHAGANCENEATTICADDHNGRQFCVNGGTCKSESHLGCNCPDGFVGPICEFQDLHIDPGTCQLDCENQGICRKGAKDISSLAKWGILNRRHLAESVLDSSLNETFNEDFEHCVCPIGYVGLRCEHKLDICPGGQHACLNGGACRSALKNGVLDFGCDCVGAASDNHRYAGEFCEMESTDFCTIDGQMPLGGPAIIAFCTNGGICKSRIHINETHPGCYCAEGFGGDNCQYAAASITNDDSGNQSNVAFVIWIFTAIGLFFAVVGAILFRRHRRLQSKGHFYSVEGNISPHSNEEMTFEASVGNGKPFDGTEYDDCSNSIASDNHSYASSQASSSKRRSKHLKKLKKKRFSTLDRTDVNSVSGDDHNIDEPSSDNNNSSLNDKDGLIKPRGQWPNATRHAIDTAAIFNEIDLGDDYGVNLVI